MAERTRQDLKKMNVVPIAEGILVAAASADANRCGSTLRVVLVGQSCCCCWVGIPCQTVSVVHLRDILWYNCSGGIRGSGTVSRKNRNGKVKMKEIGSSSTSSNSNNNNNNNNNGRNQDCNNKGSGRRGCDPTGTVVCGAV